MPASDLDSLTAEQVGLIMACVLIGISHGLDVAEKRLKGDFEIEPLSWERVKTQLELGRMPPGALDDAVTWGRQ